MVLAVIALGLIFAATQNVIAAEAEVKLEAENNDEGITLEDLQQLEPFPEFYDQLSPEARLDWLNTQIDQAATPVQNYNYQRALAFEHFFNYRNMEAQEACQKNPPLSFDLRYRFACIQVSDISYDNRLDKLLGLYQDAMEADNKEMVAQTLNSMGWYQSGHGDIELAFKSYEEALSMGEHLEFYALNDAMVNTATLYIIHGDEEYVHKGIELLKKSIERTKDKLKEEGRTGDIPNTIIIPQFNIGVAYALHVYDYEKALEWFTIVNNSKTSIPHLRMSSLLFSALSAVELGREQEAQRFLARSYDEPDVNNSEFSYLYCYQTLVRYKLGQPVDFDVCLPLHENVPLEVKIDVYKRISNLEDDGIRYAGMEQFYKLFEDKLESQIKQSSTSVASTAELHRQQQESRLRNELLEKEIALKTAQQEQREGQIRFMIAAVLALLLLVLITVIRLRQKRRLAEQFEELSVIDVLTGLKNRRFLEQNIGREFSFIKRSRAKGGQEALGIYLLDIDHFKRINDTYGHEVGDTVLIEFTRRINEAIRETDLFVRWGGEEFLLVARLENLDGLNVLAQRLRKAITELPYNIGSNQTIDLTATIGSVAYPCLYNKEEDISWNKLVLLADQALYYGKHKQRDCWVSIQSIPDRKSLKVILNQALDKSVEDKIISINSSIES